jgi:PAS domain S-box-containing protein
VALPLLMLAGFLLYEAAQAERTRLETEGSAAARDIALLLERDLAGLFALLRGLSTSTSLQSGDLRSYDARLREVHGLEGVSFVLRGRDGQQLINTRRPWGAPLPRIEDPLEKIGREVVASGQPRASGFVVGTVTGSPLFVIEAPVFDDTGVVRYLLSARVSLDRLMRIIVAKKLPKNAWVTVIDRDGVIIARTIAPDTIGTPVVASAAEAIASGPVSSRYLTSPEGVRNFASFHRVQPSGWTAAVGVPEDTLLGPLLQFLRRIAALAVAAMLLAIAAAVVVARWIARPVGQLAAAAAALGDGRALPAVSSTVAEVAKAGAALARAERELERRAAERDDLLRTLGRSPALVRELDGRILFWGAGAEQLYGWSSREAVGHLSHDLLATELPAPLPEIEATLREKGSWEGVLRHRSKDGRMISVASHWAVRRDRVTGELLSVVETNTDITQKLKDQERLSMLAREVDHRAKNMLAVIQSLMRLSRADTVREYMRLVQGRIAALARAHTLLSESRWQGVSLQRLVAEELAPYRRRGDHRVRISGPEIAVAPAAAQPVAMVLHELATNAVKYGALSVADGHVEVSWSSGRDGAVVLSWTELEGPPVAAVPGAGFGTVMIERTVRDQLGGSVAFDWRSSGVACRITVPLDTIAGRRDTAA